MKIGVLGAGNVGGNLGRLMHAAGHDVLVGARSGAASLKEAAAHGDVVIVAVHYRAATEALTPLSEALAGKIVVDATNPLKDDWSPLLLGQENSAAEEISRLLPGSRIVKAFNTVFADVMAPERLNRNEHKVSVFVASDDPSAIETVAELSFSIGFAPVTIDKLSAARHLEALAHLNIELAVGQGGGTNAAFLYHRG